MGSYNRFTAIALLALHLSTPANALPENHTDSQVNAVIDAGTFSNPSVNVRPKFRYWIPDASIDPTSLAADIDGLGQIGAGGIEFLPYYLYGGESFLGNVTSPDWDIYGYGLPQYNNILKAGLQAIKDNGMIMDLSFGPQSGQGVPAEIGNPGLAWQVTSFNLTIPAGTTFSGVIPGFGSGTLQSVVTAQIINSTQHNLTADFPDVYSLYTQYTTTYYAPETLSEVTIQVQSNGHLTFTAPAEPSNVEYIIIASFSSQSYTRACIPGPDPQNFLQNGSFAVDHFSAVGAKVTTDFLEQYVLVNGVKELMEEVGNYVWEDSIEIFATAYWSPNLPSVFQQMHGYSIGKYIPLLAKQNAVGFFYESVTWYMSDESDAGISYVDDYRETLTYMYSQYMAHFVDWAHEYLDLQYSCQVGYGMPVDSLAGVPVPDAPELETLEFNNSIDAFRQYSGPANLAGKRIISCELGATLLKAYQTSLADLVDDSKHSFAGGSNMMVIHGATYSHQYFETSWPGYTSFNYEYSEQHSRHQPAWEVGYSDSVNFIARTQFVQQIGTPKRDFVFWNKQPAQSSFGTLYTATDIVAAGYSYDYLSPDNFALSQAIVSDHILALSGPAYKAMVVPYDALLTVDGVSRLAGFAKSGLPIIFYGGIPSTLASHNDSGSAFVASTLKAMQSLGSVHLFNTGTLAGALEDVGITPLTQVSSNGTWWTNWRQDPSGNDYVYIYNEGNYSSEGSINFATTGTPYYFDAWTGEQTPVLNYTAHSRTTEIRIQLASKQSMMIAFATSPIPGIDLPNVYFTQTPDSIIGFSYSKAEGLIAKTTSFVTSRNSIPLVTSDHTRHEINAPNVPAPFTLSNYTLIAEHWDHPDNLFDVETIANKYNTTHVLPYLLPWLQIPGLSNTSGVGYYTSTFSWPPPGGNSSLGAIIDFGPVIHSLRASINGSPLPTLDLTWARTDISSFLKEGENIVEAVISTRMANGLRPIWNQLMTSGTLNALPVPDELEEGLVGTVTVVPYAKVVVA